MRYVTFYLYFKPGWFILLLFWIQIFIYSNVLWCTFYVRLSQIKFRWALQENYPTGSELYPPPPPQTENKWKVWGGGRFRWSWISFRNNPNQSFNVETWMGLNERRISLTLCLENMVFSLKSFLITELTFPCFQFKKKWFPTPALLSFYCVVYFPCGALLTFTWLDLAKKKYKKNFSYFSLTIYGSSNRFFKITMLSFELIILNSKSEFLLIDKKHFYKMCYDNNIYLSTNQGGAWHPEASDRHVNPPAEQAEHHVCPEHGPRPHWLRQHDQEETQWGLSQVSRNFVWWALLIEGIAILPWMLLYWL